MKATVSATGYSQDLLDQPIAEDASRRTTCCQSSYKPIELNGPGGQDVL